ncbi:nucleoside triphosphate pyrophosphatase [Corynebacterium ulceribovis]|uniref:nucleoside triphosphate pyrophosphatase n=1 Tax=Corynebacterium ulceribovis TaxID=487732 RepID=UPI0003805DF3|nr:nucleoside triphosphate pyrophosphatase [Corynebacterium ulceribovis]
MPVPPTSPSPHSSADQPLLILASQSPSRLGILRAAGADPQVRVSGVDEDAIIAELGSTATPPQVVQALADAKARAVAEELLPELIDDLGPTLIVGGDSMLLLDGQLQGKPHTVEATIARWRQQRGKTAQLLTGQAVLEVRGGEIRRATTAYSATNVTFAAASDADIAAYAESGEPLECAGAFTLEARGGWFIDRIEGDPSAVIGLSLPLLRAALADWGFHASDLWG